MKDKQLHLIYIPGLGDRRVGGQRWVVTTWRNYGVEAELFHMDWTDAVPWEEKFSKLLERIDTLAGEGKQVGLVGASAGGSAVINAYAARKDTILGCFLIAGKINRPNAIGPKVRKEDPSFITSAYACEEALKTLNEEDRHRILSRYAFFDGLLIRADSYIPGAHNQIVPTIGHVPTIATQITIGIPSAVRFLKQLDLPTLTK